MSLLMLFQYGISECIINVQLTKGFVFCRVETMKYINGASMFSDISKIVKAKSFSISPENFTGEKGGGAMATEGTGAEAARELGKGWKISPSVKIPGKTCFTLADIEGSGKITHIWMTCGPDRYRCAVLKMYWDNEETPSVAVPLGDFFCCGLGKRANVNSLAVTVNPAGGFNCYFPMPFKKHAKIVLDNIDENETLLYYQIDFERTETEPDQGYFHARFNASRPVKYMGVHTILDGVTGCGQYIGTYMTWQVNNNGWWGEGEVKFYIDGDREYPTICGTGTEDYFGGAWNFEYPQGEYGLFSTAYQGLTQVEKPDGLYQANTRFSMYRWHLTDPVRFEKDLKVTVQALGWRSKGRYLPLKDEITSVAFWYQKEPHAKFNDEFDVNELEII